MKLKFYKKKWFKYSAGAVLCVAIILGYFYFSFVPEQNPVWGINFSPTYARYLGFSPVQMFGDILQQLQPQKVRLMVYWEEIEPQPGQYDFTLYDQLLNQAQDSHVGVILVVGRKEPRWPECHQPEWVTKLSTEEQRQQLLDMLQITINHFKNFSTIERWQVENEPFFDYGKDCPVSSKGELKQEVGLVKSLDNRPVVLTDSGEKGGWFATARLADVFGSTMYRKVFNPRYGGYVTYPLPPAFYRMRAGMLKVFLHTKEIIGVELQAEPWFSKDIHDTTVEEQKKLMNPEIFAQYAAYAKKVGFSENYLWGAEWWYWLKNAEGDAGMWLAAQNLLKNN